MGPSFPPLGPLGDEEGINPTSSPSSLLSSHRNLNKQSKKHNSFSGDTTPSVLDAQFRVRGVQNLRVAGLISASTL